MKSFLIWTTGVAVFAAVCVGLPAEVLAARSLYNGVSGEDVTQLQKTLIAQGYLAEGYATGYFGSLTEAAVKKFQCAHGIVCSGTSANGYGVYGPKTQTALAEATNYPESVTGLTGFMTPIATGAFEVSGWIPYWRAATGTKDVLPHLSTLTSVMPFGYTMKTNGTLADTAKLSEEPWVSFIAEAKKQGVYIVPSVMWGNGDSIHAVLSNTAKRVALEDEIAAAVFANGFDGIDIDFEAKKRETINYFSTFLKGLYQRMGNKWVYCTVEARMPLEHRYLPGTPIPPDAADRANDYDAMNKYCDRVEIMAYDQGRVDVKLNSERAEPYAPVADVEWVEVLVRLAAQSIGRNKLIVGIPTYGYGYKVTPKDGGGNDYRRLWAFNPAYALDIAEKLGITPARTNAGELGFTYNPDELEQAESGSKKLVRRRAKRDAWEETKTGESFYFVTWSDEEAIRQKIDLAHRLGVRGIAFFKFDGGEDQGVWRLFE